MRLNVFFPFLLFAKLPYGFGTAVGIRVGHHLGAGCSHGPRFTLSVALLAICKSDHIGIGKNVEQILMSVNGAEIFWLIPGSLMPICFAIVLGLREYIPFMFSKDR